MFLKALTNQLMLLFFLGVICAPIISADDFTAGQQWSRVIGTSTYQVVRSQHFVLPTDAQLSIAGATANLVVADAMQNILGSRFASVQVSAESLDLSSARQQARQQQAQFLFYYRVQQWHKGHWQQTQDCPQKLQHGWLCRLQPHNPLDKAQLTIWLWDVAGERLMDTITVQATSSVLSFWNQSPADLVDSPLQQALLSYSANIN
jgi:hypothetical protein